MATTPTQAGGAQPVVAGSLFGFPGTYRPISEPENNDQTTITLKSAATVGFTTVVPFKNSDVITDWTLDLTITNTFTAGTTTVTDATGFPYNFLGPTKIVIQNQYPSLDLTDGFDAMLFEQLHPTVREDTRQYAGANPSATWAGGTLQTNAVSTVAATSGSATIQLSLVLPVSVELDTYWDLTSQGQPTGLAPHRAIVSPQWMAGNSRSVTPRLTYNALIGTTCDTSPYVVSGTTLGTASGSVLQTWRRNGFYGNDDIRVLPPVYNWQSQRTVIQYNFGVATKFDIPISADTGQILTIYLRFFDSTSGTDAPIAVSTVNVAQLKFGSGLKKFDDTYREMQKRLMQQLGLILPQGCLAWLVARDRYGLWNNACALNTYTTASPSIHIELSGAQGTGAYVKVGIEHLAYVQQ